MVTVTKVELREQGHMANDEPQGGVRDVQAGETQLHDVPELAPIVHLTWGAGSRQHISLTRLERPTGQVLILGFHFAVSPQKSEVVSTFKSQKIPHRILHF